MKALLPALLVLCAIQWASANPVPNSNDDAAPAPILVSKSGAKRVEPGSRSIILNLPPQTGKVNSTNQLANGDVLVHGDKYESRCGLTNRGRVACVPILATPVVRDITIGAKLGPKGEQQFTFKVAAGSTRPKDGIAYAVRAYLTRAAQVARHFDRMAVSSAPGRNSTNLIAAGGDSCVFDDDGEIVCTGGDGSSDEGGSGGTFPSGSPADPDPCIDPDGNRICADPSQIPQVPVPGPLPPDPACDTQEDGTVICGMQASGAIPGMPPFWIPPGQITNWNAPFWPQWACNRAPVLCSRGQEPQTDPNAPPKPEEIPTLDWNDPAKPPVGPNGEQWEWHGQPPQGGAYGGYVNPSNPDQSVHPDLDHAPPVGPHWDYTDRNKTNPGWRIYPDGKIDKN